MSKELTPLEVSKQLNDFVLEFVKNGLDRMFIRGSFDIIEAALKRLEEIDKLPKTEFYTTNKIELNNELDKKLKALEIIKDIAKSYDVEFCDKKQTISFKIMFHSKFILETITIKDKEEYDLLKEVLL